MAIKQWHEKGLHHAPDERAAAAANEEDDKAEDTIEIDGEKYTRADAVNALQNKATWQRELKQKEQSLAESRKMMESVVNRALERPSTPAEAEEPVLDLDDVVDELPDPIEDPVAFKASLKKVLKANKDAASKEAKSQAKAETEQATGRLSREQASDRADAAMKDNVSRARTYYKENYPQLSAQQVEQVMTKLSNLRGDDYGSISQYGHGFAVRALNEQAFEDALQLTPTVRSAREAAGTNKARKEGLRAGNAGQGMGNEAPIEKPSPNAPLADQIAWFRTQSEEVVERAVASMSPQEKDALARELYGSG